MITYKTKAHPLDIIIVYNPRSWLHRLIYGVTHYKAGHVALYLGDGRIIEANSSGVHVKDWKNYRDGMLVYLGRCGNLNEDRELKIRQYAADMVNKEYAFAQLAMIFFKNLFGVRHIPDVSKQAVICSEFVARAFKEAGILLCPGIRPEETTPGDIMRSRELFLIKGWE